MTARKSPFQRPTNPPTNALPTHVCHTPPITPLCVGRANAALEDAAGPPTPERGLDSIDTIAAAPSAPPKRRARWRTYRLRQDQGIIMITVPVDPALVNLLVRSKWLLPREYHTRTEIADAIVRWHASMIDE